MMAAPRTNPPVLANSQLLLAALAGLAMPLSFAPFNWGFVMPLQLALLLWLQYGKTPKQAFVLGVCFGTPGFIASLHWIYISTHVYSGAPMILALFLLLLLGAYLSLYGAAAAAIAATIGRSAQGQPQFWPWLLAYVLSWPLLEQLRNTVFDGFPWLSLGYSQIDAWLVGLAPLAGVFVIAIPVLLMASLPLAWAQGYLRSTAAIVLVLLGLGFWGQQQQWTEATGAPLKVGIVQGNIEQDQKWLPSQRWPTVRRYKEMSERLIPQADLIVWPEVAIPGAFREFYPSLFRPLQQRLEASNSQLLAGIMRWDDEQERYANAIVQLPLKPGLGPRFYDKQHLVPFAEFFPVPDFVRGWLKALELPFTDLYSAPANKQPFQIGEHLAAASICFEDSFGAEIAASARDVGLLVNVSNDAWFGRSIAAAQHEQIARMRSIETQRWMVRATPTGFSAFIDPHGQVLQRLPRGEIATAVAELQPRLGQTPYMLIGDQWMLLLLLLLLALWLWSWRRRSLN